MSVYEGTEVQEARRPLLWYGLPHGFQNLDLDPSQERLLEVRQELASLSCEKAMHARQVLDFYRGVVELLRRQDVVSSAIGIHPDESGGVALSVFSVSSTALGGLDPKAVLTRMLDSRKGASAESGVKPLLLPCGLAFFKEDIPTRRVPGYGADDSGPQRQGRVWEGTVMVPNTLEASVVTLQLSSAAVNEAQNYRQILIGIAHTLTFTDPAVAEKWDSEPSYSTISKEMKDTFG